MANLLGGTTVYGNLSAAGMVYGTNTIPSLYVLPSDRSCGTSSLTSIFGVTDNLLANSVYEFELGVILNNTTGSNRIFGVAVSGTGTFTANFISLGYEINGNLIGLYAPTTTSSTVSTSQLASLGSNNTDVGILKAYVTTTNAVGVTFCTYFPTSITGFVKAGSYKKVTKIS